MRALSLADPASESPLESQSRGVVLSRGIPPPICGAPVLGADGVTYWADMLWEDQRVIGECDGASKYTTPDVLWREKLRQESLEQAGWRVVRWTYADIQGNSAPLIVRLRRALARRR